LSKAPEGLIDARPALADNPPAHPATGPDIGAPPRRYSRGVHDRIVELIKKRNRPVVAAAACGIPQSTFYAWMRMGKEGNPHLTEFVDDVEQALAEAEVGAVAVITGQNEQFDDDPDNAKWWLSVTRPEGYSKDAIERANGMIREFITRLEQNLPPHVFAMVLTAAAGSSTTLPSAPLLAQAETEEADE
jgi:hypothetical protein